MHQLMCISLTYEAGQRVLKLNRESGACSSIQFSNIGILGFPYWLSTPLERVFNLLVNPFPLIKSTILVLKLT